ncbi:MAG: hypothetical protein CMJ81_15400 [Planctomycetaceae bacterium]|nr:hypothetical protein [Planctomycetaceae bacterium]
MATRYQRESPLQNKEPPLLFRVLSLWLVVSLLLAHGITCDAGTSHDLDLAIDDIPEPLDSVRERTESDEDRVLAAAQVAMGRLFLQRKQYKLALKAFQRAHRDDPHSVSVMKDIVQLQLALHREEEAARYALLATNTGDQDPALLRQLAMMLTEQFDFSGAIKLYERSATFDMTRKPDARTVLIHLEKGRLYYLTQQYQKAAESFKVVRDALDNPERYKLDPQMRQLVLGRSEVTYALMAEVLLEAEQYDDAEEMFRAANAAKPNEALLAYRLADVEARRGKPRQALESLQNFLDAKTSFEGTSPYALLSKLLQLLEQNPEVAQKELIARLETLNQKDSSNQDLSYFLGQQYLRSKQWDEAHRIFSILVTKESNLRGYYGLVEVLIAQKRDSELLEVLGQIVAKTGTLEISKELQHSISADKDLVKRCIDICDKLDEVGQKKIPGARLSVALLALRAGNHEAADRLYAQALAAAASPPEEMVLAWGMELFFAERHAQAARVIQEALDRSIVPEENAYVYYFLAGTLELAGQTDRALEAAQQAARIRPTSPQYRSREPWILYHAERYSDAYAKYEELLRDFDDDYTIRGGRTALRDARFILSNVCVIRKDLDEAEEWLEQILDEFPEDTGALNDLGFLYADRGKRLRRSLEMVTKAVEVEPENEAYLDSLGWALFRSGDYARAVGYLEKASDRENPDAVILDHLGDVYWKLLRHEEARQVWRRASRAFEKTGNQEQLEKTDAKIRQESPD